MNPVIGKKVAIGLHMAATLLLGEILDTTYRSVHQHAMVICLSLQGGPHARA